MSDLEDGDASAANSELFWSFPVLELILPHDEDPNKYESCPCGCAGDWRNGGYSNFIVCIDVVQDDFFMM